MNFLIQLLSVWVSIRGLKDYLIHVLILYVHRWVSRLLLYLLLSAELVMCSLDLYFSFRLVSLIHKPLLFNLQVGFSLKWRLLCLLSNDLHKLSLFTSLLYLWAANALSRVPLYPYAFFLTFSLFFVYPNLWKFFLSVLVSLILSTTIEKVFEFL